MLTHPDKGRCSSQLSGLDEFSKMHPVHQYTLNIPSLVVFFFLHKLFFMNNEE